MTQKTEYTLYTDVPKSQDWATDTNDSMANSFREVASTKLLTIKINQEKQNESTVEEMFVIYIGYLD